MENLNLKNGGAEKFIRPSSGWLVLFLSLVGITAGIAVPGTIEAMTNDAGAWWLLLLVTLFSLIMLCGLFIVNPNESTVVTFLENMSARLSRTVSFL